jgi:hypothetical protein
MAERNSTYPTRSAFVVDPNSLIRGSGRQIDWDQVSKLFVPGSFNIVVGAAGAAPGATSVPVAALEGAVPAGTILDFGVDSFTVTMNAAALAAATSITVLALPKPVQAGQLLDFGGAKFARVATDTAAGATAIPVDAIPTALAGAETALVKGSKIVEVSTAALAGDTALVVEVLPHALDSGDSAIAPGSTEPTETGITKFIPAGTVVAELASGKVVPRASRPGSEVATGILETAANEDSVSDAATGYSVIVGGNLYENQLPDADPTTGLLPSGYKTELAAAGTGFAFEQYADSRAS